LRKAKNLIFSCDSNYFNTNLIKKNIKKVEINFKWNIFTKQNNVFNSLRHINKVVIKKKFCEIDDNLISQYLEEIYGTDTERKSNEECEMKRKNIYFHINCHFSFFDNSITPSVSKIEKVQMSHCSGIYLPYLKLLSGVKYFIIVGDLHDQKLGNYLPLETVSKIKNIEYLKIKTCYYNLTINGLMQLTKLRKLKINRGLMTNEVEAYLRKKNIEIVYS
jgi:hypothetical protein